MPRIGLVKTLVAERKIGDDVAVDRLFERQPVDAGGIADCAAVDLAL